MRIVVTAFLLMCWVIGFALSGQGESAAGILDNVNPVITLTSPAGGEHWYIDDIHDITWTATDTNFPANPIQMQYSLNNGVNFLALADAEANDGLYPWTIPANQTTTARVQVKATDAFGNFSTLLSNAFRISYVPPQEPGGVAIDTGNGHDAVITWQPVSQTIYNTPITPDVYVVEYSENAVGPFYYLGFKLHPDTTFTHPGVLLYGNGGHPADHMYYHVIAHKDYSRGLVNALNDLAETNPALLRKNSWMQIVREIEARQGEK